MVKRSNRSDERTVEVGVLGGSGYIGSELLRYLLVHPSARVRWVTARSRVGEEISGVLPNLHGLIAGRFLSLDEAMDDLAPVEAVFVALPHNSSQEVIPELVRVRPDLRIVDMGGDFRTPDPDGYRAHYGREHAAPELLSRFCYGFTEYQRERLAGVRLVANPGCFATSLVIALCPLARAKILQGEVYATGVTGSSGSGNVPKPTTHHPERGTNFRAYKPLVHQHLLEVETFVGSLGDRPFRLNFVPQSGPFVRGIFTTVFVRGLAADALEELYVDAYGDSRLIRVRHGSPDLRLVQGTPRTEIGIAADGDRGVVFVALDNLGKGAAGQAIQNFNLLFGLEETTGLLWPGGFV